MEERKLTDFQVGLVTGGMVMFESLIRVIKDYAEELEGRDEVSDVLAVGLKKGMQDWQAMRSSMLDMLTDKELENRGMKAPPLHLFFDGVEYRDERCGCRYHADDPNDSHNGGPHVHPCERHKPAVEREEMRRALLAFWDYCSSDLEAYGGRSYDYVEGVMQRLGVNTEEE